jgi:4-amino-4-deoxy-L-arabinose transferase-like glycosyltransferase
LTRDHIPVNASASDVTEPASRLEPQEPAAAQAESAPAPHRRLLTAVPSQRQSIAVLLGVLALLLGLSMIDESPTTDEPLHLTRGLAYFWGPDASLSYQHPPLGNAFAALPVVLSASRIDIGALDGYARGETWTVARSLLAPHYGKRRPWLFEARAMMALLCIGLAFYGYRLGAKLFGPAVGLWTLLFFALHPTLIAHGRLDTTDMPVTAAMLIATGELVFYLLGGSRWHGVTAAVAVGAGVVCKHTGLAMVPLATGAVLLTAALGLGRHRGQRRAKALAEATLFVTLSALMALFVINAAYRFERTGLTAAEMLSLPEPAPEEPKGFGGEVLERSSILPKLPPALPIPLPYTYVFGLSVLRAHAGGGHPTTFFGERMRHGHPAYFPVMLLIKTPLPLLFALGCALVIAIRRRGRLSLASWLLGGYAVCLVMMAMRGSINIGVRHVLPMIPIMCLFGGLGMVHLLRTLGAEAERRLALGVVLASLIGVIWSFPDYLSDFNMLVAGRLGGERISIVGEEWGQDTLRLGRALRERGIDEVYFSGDSFTTRPELARQQVTSRKFKCPKVLPSNAYVALQARDIAREIDTCARWTRSRKPLFDVNGHVFVYRTGPDEQPL